MLRAEATHVRVDGRPSTYGWIISVGDVLVELSVKRGKEHQFTLRRDVDARQYPETITSPRTLAHVPALIATLGVTETKTTVLTQFFWVPESVLRRLRDNHPAMQKNTVNELFARFGAGLTQGVL